MFAKNLDTRAGYCGARSVISVLSWPVPSSDTAITAKIKAKYTMERDLSMFGISVNTTDGRVTLAGNVTSPQQIGKAMLIALETDGVREVNSTLQVKSPTHPSS